MAFKAGACRAVGGVDTRFKHYCADSDLALRLTLSGRPSYRVWWPLVPHEEHGAFQKTPGAREAAAQRDLQLFYEKWGHTGPEMERIALAKLESELEGDST